MSLTPVNGLALAAITFVIGAACTSADGRTRGAAPSGATASATTSASATSAPAATQAAPASHADDSLAARADLGRIQGSPSARVWLVEVSDLQCPYCKEWHDSTYPTILDKYIRTGKVRMAYVNFPLPQHQNAQAAATSAMCASAQGKFWPVHDVLFRTQSHWESLPDPQARAYFDSVATRAGVNPTAYESCLGSPAIQALISADKDRAERAGVNSTPTFLINGGGKPFPPIAGAVPAADMSRVLDSALSATSAR